MRIYTVLENPGRSDESRVILVKDGFCWPAFIGPINLIWAIGRRVWRGIAVYLSAALVIAALSHAMGLGALAEAGLYFLLALAAGFEANDWRRAALLRRGWRERAIVSGGDLDEAERRYFESVAS